MPYAPKNIQFLTKHRDNCDEWIQNLNKTWTTLSHSLTYENQSSKQTNRILRSEIHYIGIEKRKQSILLMKPKCQFFTSKNYTRNNFPNMFFFVFFHQICSIFISIDCQSVSFTRILDRNAILTRYCFPHNKRRSHNSKIRCLLVYRLKPTKMYPTWNQ